MLKKVDDFKLMQNELAKDDVNLGHKTLCIDIENIFVRKVNIMEVEELNMLFEIQKYDYYILVDHNAGDEESEEDKEDNEEEKEEKSNHITNKLEIN